MINMNSKNIPVLICAYNEAENLPRVIRDLRKINYNSQNLDVIVVNDGSTDNTSYVAHKSGATKVIDISRNVGKATAFFQGFREIEPFYSANFISLDADLESVNDLQVQSLLTPLTKPNISMTIGSVCGAMSSLSGQRGYKISSLRNFIENSRYSEFISENSKIRIGYGLEILLNHFFTGYSDLSSEIDYDNVRFVDSDLKCFNAKLDESKIKHKMGAIKEVRRARIICQNIERD